MSADRLIGTAVAAVVLIWLAFFLTSCAERPIEVNRNVDCPQPASQALSRAEGLKGLPALPGDDPSAVVGILTQALAEDADAYAELEGKFETLVDHGVRLCRWSRTEEQK